MAPAPQGIKPPHSLTETTCRKNITTPGHSLRHICLEIRPHYALYVQDYRAVDLIGDEAEGVFASENLNDIRLEFLNDFKILFAKISIFGAEAEKEFFYS